MAFGKRKVVLAALVLALGSAVYLNWQFSSNTDLLSTNSITKTKELGEAKYVNNNKSKVPEEKKDGKSESEPKNATEYFAKAKLTRQKARDEVTEMVKGILADANSSEQAKAEAIKQAAVVAKNIQQESNIENLIKAKGFTDCLVFINGDECSVVVSPGSLVDGAAITIKDIVAGQGGIAMDKIKIVEAK